jgi:hypothetical protein
VLSEDGRTFGPLLPPLAALVVGAVESSVFADLEARVEGPLSSDALFLPKIRY